MIFNLIFGKNAVVKVFFLNLIVIAYHNLHKKCKKVDPKF